MAEWPLRQDVFGRCFVAKCCKTSFLSQESECSSVSGASLDEYAEDAEYATKTTVETIRSSSHSLFAIQDFCIERHQTRPVFQATWRFYGLTSCHEIVGYNTKFICEVLN